MSYAKQYTIAIAESIAFNDVHVTATCRDQDALSVFVEGYKLRYPQNPFETRVENSFKEGVYMAQIRRGTTEGT